VVSSIITFVNENAAPPVVLVADDEPTMLELVARHLRSLEQPKLEVIEASDGDEAWRLARERLPDLVVLDVMMPGMSGWEVCRKIRHDAALAHTGVVMLTGIGESLNEATSPLFGADEYIDKPFDLEQLDQRIVAVLGKRAAQREAVPRPLANTRSADRPRVGNGVGGPAKVAASASSSSSRTRKAKSASKQHQKKQQKKSAKAEKGRHIMAAKKAKKSAKKAKKSAKKAKKK
jgi:DNA-binding response OmpR family regulator